MRARPQISARPCHTHALTLSLGSAQGARPQTSARPCHTHASLSTRLQELGRPRVAHGHGRGVHRIRTLTPKPSQNPRPVLLGVDAARGVFRERCAHSAPKTSTLSLSLCGLSLVGACCRTSRERCGGPRHSSCGCSRCSPSSLATPPSSASVLRRIDTSWSSVAATLAARPLVAVLAADDIEFLDCFDCDVWPSPLTASPWHGRPPRPGALLFCSSRRQGVGLCRAYQRTSASDSCEARTLVMVRC